MVDMRNASTILVEENGKRDHFQDLGVDVKKMLKWVLKKYWECGLDSSGSEQSPVAGSCEDVSEPLGFINGEKFLQQLSDY